MAGAERNFREALRISRSEHYVEGIAYITCNLALLAMVREDWVSAETLGREALSLSEKVGRQELIALACDRLATALVAQGKKAEALLLAQRAEEILTRLNSPELTIARETLAVCES